MFVVDFVLCVIPLSLLCPKNYTFISRPTKDDIQGISFLVHPFHPVHLPSCLSIVVYRVTTSLHINYFKTEYL